MDNPQCGRDYDRCQLGVDVCPDEVLDLMDEWQTEGLSKYDLLAIVRFGKTETMMRAAARLLKYRGEE